MLPRRKNSGSVRVSVSPPSGMFHTRMRASSHAGETSNHISNMITMATAVT